MFQNYTPKDIEKFWNKVAKTDNPADCWLWTAGCLKIGYGVTRKYKHPIYCHRLAWILTFGDVPDGLFVCHKCDVRNCCNPSHLFLGTAKDNAVDMTNKKRNYLPQKYAPRGESHWNHKLTAFEVDKIRSRYKAGGILQRELAAEFGVVQGTIEYVLGKGWKQRKP